MPALFPGIETSHEQIGIFPHATTQPIPDKRPRLRGGDHSDDFGSLAIRNNHGERGFTVARSTADGSRVTAYPNIFRGWQWGIGTNGPWPVRVSGAGTPRVAFSVRQTWKGTYDASLDIWFSTYPNKTTQAGGAEIMIFLSHPHVFAAGKKIRADGTDWYVNEWKPKATA